MALALVLHLVARRCPLARRAGSSASTQVSLLPPPCDELTTSDPSERDARQPAGQHVDVLAVEDVRPQVDVPAFEAPSTIVGTRDSDSVGWAM